MKGQAMAMRLIVKTIGWGAVSALALAPLLAGAQSADPNSDLTPVPVDESGYGTDVAPPPTTPAPMPGTPVDQSGSAMPAPQPSAGQAPVPTAPPSRGPTYQKNDVIGAAEGVFGRGAEGLAKLIESILRDQGEPTAYITGREVGAAFAVGLRYGSGTLYHKVEGEMPVYWTGPSIGLDVGAQGSKTFVLVYNLYDSNELYKRFPGGEGIVYLVGGFNASYQRQGDVVVIPIRLGVGWRLGANVGYLKFTRKSRILPF
jgi:hypothetical protein